MSILLTSLPYLLRGALVTVELSAICLFGGTVIGIVLGTIAAIGPRWIGYLIATYVFVVRGVPVLIIMFLAYFGLPAVGIEISSIHAVAGALTIYSASYVTEILRGALRGVDQGQIAAGKSIGLRWWQLLWHIEMPQAAMRSIGPIVNNSIVMVKATSYASIVGLWELTFAGREIVERTLAPFQIFLGILVIYFIICYPLGIAAKVLDRHYRFSA
jgi:His/Glu/Gln/Arg/opine family amino acid ABC transporter permease subunit